MSDLIAVIAPGEMGAGIGQRLRERGARVITSLAGRSAASGKRAERAGMAAVASDDEIVKADIILSVVPPKDAAGLAQRLKPAIARAANKPIYVDCNAVAPQTAERDRRDPGGQRRALRRRRHHRGAADADHAGRAALRLGRARHAT